MKGKNLKLLGIFIGCLVGISAIAGVNFAVAADEAPEPTEIVLGTTTTIAAGTFGNDSKIVEYYLTIPAGIGVNLTLQNANLSKLSWSISVEQEIAYSDCVSQVCKGIASQTAGDGATKYAPDYQSFVYMAIDEVTLKICVKAEGYYNWDADVDDGKFQLVSGAIVPTQIWNIESNFIAEGASSYAANFSALPLTGSGIVAKTFNVSKDGWYLFTLNASEGEAAMDSGKSIMASVSELDEADAETAGDGIEYAYGDITSVGQLQRDLVDRGTPGEAYLTYEPMYLESDEEYLLAFMEAGGPSWQVLGDVVLTWSAMNVTDGALGVAGNAVNFASSLITVVREGNNQWSTWVELDELDTETLYDLSLAGISDMADWWVASVEVFGKTWNGMPVTYNQSGKLFGFDLECYDEITVDGEKYEDRIALIYSECEVPAGNVLGGLNGTDEDWAKDNVVESTWEMPLAKITVTNTTVGKAMGTLPTTNLKVAENADGVADLPASGSTMTKIYNTTGDTMGLYKLEGMKGKEVQFTFGNMTSLVNPTFEYLFYGECDYPNVMYSAVVDSWGSNSFTFHNRSLTWGAKYADGLMIPNDEVANKSVWDPTLVWFEVATFVDDLYVLVDLSGDETTINNKINTTTFTMNYQEEDFLKSGDEWTASRNNKIQVLTASVGPCTKAVLEPVYGHCCTSVTVSARMMSCCDMCTGYIHATKGAWSLSSPLPSYWPHCTSCDGYLIMTVSGLTDGSVWKLTLTTPSAAIPGYPMFFVLIASLSVVAALVWKRKRR